MLSYQLYSFLWKLESPGENNIESKQCSNLRSVPSLSKNVFRWKRVRGNFDSIFVIYLLSMVFANSDLPDGVANPLLFLSWSCEL